MKNIVIFDTSIATMNLGDEIIMRSIRSYMKDFLDANYCINFPTHTPPFYSFQRLYAKDKMTVFDNMDYKFVCGTNLLYTNMLRPLPNWNINLMNTRIYKNSILLGVGMGKNSEKTTSYTKKLYKRVLSKQYAHSVRDERTEQMLKDMDFKVINTGCPTLWKLDKTHCSEIPQKKSNNVVFTLTHYDYARSEKLDCKLIEVLKKNYSKVYFWPQCIDDLTYLKKINKVDDVIVLPANLNSYERLLQGGDLDYVGSRLHGGIFALQNKCRSIILAVDHRALDMKLTFNIPCVKYEEIDNGLQDLINSEFKTEIVGLDYEKINDWIAQF